MNDKDIELIKSTLQTIGSVGQQGFSELVYWHRLDGLFSIIGYSILITGALWLLRRAFKWKAEYEAELARAATIIALCFAILCFVCGVENGFVSVLAPEGAAIHSILAK